MVIGMEWVYFFALCASVYAIYRIVIYFLSEKGYTLSNGKRTLLGWIVIISVITPYWIYTEKHSIKDGNTYYVNLFEKQDAQKNYRVPGLIYIEEDGYHLAVIYWNNGGETTFENLNNDNLLLGEKILVTDDEMKQWYVELTKEKAE